jgi:hypothetical protein
MTEAEEEKEELHMSAEEMSATAVYPMEVINGIDDALFAQTDKHWRKTARILAHSMKSYPETPESYFLERLILLVENGKLECHGNLRFVRHSEVRRLF